MWIIQVKLQRWANHIWWIRKVGHQRNKKKIIKTRINHVLSAWHAKIFIAYLGDCLSKEIQFSHWPTKRYNWTKCFGWTQKHIPRSTDSLATQLTNPHNAFETSFMWLRSFRLYCIQIWIGHLIAVASLPHRKRTALKYTDTFMCCGKPRTSHSATNTHTNNDVVLSRTTGLVDDVLTTTK